MRVSTTYINSATGTSSIYTVHKLYQRYILNIQGTSTPPERYPQYTRYINSTRDILNIHDTLTPHTGCASGGVMFPVFTRMPR